MRNHIFMPNTSNKEQGLRFYRSVNRRETLHILWNEKRIQHNLECTKPKWQSRLECSWGSVKWADKNSKKKSICGEKKEEVETFSKYAIHRMFEQIETSYAASFSEDELLQMMSANPVLVVYSRIWQQDEVEIEAAAIFSHSYLMSTHVLFTAS